MAAASLEALPGRFSPTLVIQGRAEPIIGSYRGGSEAGSVGRSVYVRADTPLHSLLHETCHIVCMTGERRRRLRRDAGGDELAEASVCHLQVVLAAELPGVGPTRIMRDMDAWGCSFRLGSAAAWFRSDAEDARNWLIINGLLDAGGAPTWALRSWRAPPRAEAQDSPARE